MSSESAEIFRNKSRQRRRKPKSSSHVNSVPENPSEITTLRMLEESLIPEIVREVDQEIALSSQDTKIIVTKGNSTPPTNEKFAVTHGKKQTNMSKSKNVGVIGKSSDHKDKGGGRAREGVTRISKSNEAGVNAVGGKAGLSIEGLRGGRGGGRMGTGSGVLEGGGPDVKAVAVEGVTVGGGGDKVRGGRKGKSGSGGLLRVNITDILKSVSISGSKTSMQDIVAMPVARVPRPGVDIPPSRADRSTDLMMELEESPDIIQFRLQSAFEHASNLMKPLESSVQKQLEQLRRDRTAMKGFLTGAYLDGVNSDILNNIKDLQDTYLRLFKQNVVMSIHDNIIQRMWIVRQRFLECLLKALSSKDPLNAYGLTNEQVQL
jgi:hypothetical protein